MEPNMVKLEWSGGRRALDLTDRPLIMGILNINDDSFSQDGRVDAEWAVRRAEELIEEGADIVDVGAESARTNREPISEEEEIRRLLPLLEAWPEIAARAEGAREAEEQVSPPLLSVNTWRIGVMEAVLAHGAVDLLNDMSGLAEPGPAELAARAGCALLVMHTVGLPKQPHTHVRYEDIVETLRGFFKERLARCEEAGLPRERVVLDPGLGFAKTTGDDVRILQELESLLEFRRPLLLPISRKGFIGRTLGVPDPRERDAGTIACLVAGLERGGRIFRMHNVRAAREILRTWRGCRAEPC